MLNLLVLIYNIFLLSSLFIFHFLIIPCFDHIINLNLQLDLLLVILLLSYLLKEFLLIKQLNHSKTAKIIYLLFVELLYLLAPKFYFNHMNQYCIKLSWNLFINLNNSLTIYHEVFHWFFEEMNRRILHLILFKMVLW